MQSFTLGKVRAMFRKCAPLSLFREEIRLLFISVYCRKTTKALSVQIFWKSEQCCWELLYSCVVTTSQQGEDFKSILLFTKPISFEKLILTVAVCLGKG